MNKTRTISQSFNQLDALINEIRQSNNLLASAIECAQSQCKDIKKEIEEIKITEEV